jgi:hypothetical protein
MLISLEPFISESDIIEARRRLHVPCSAALPFRRFLASMHLHVKIPRSLPFQESRGNTKKYIEIFQIANCVVLIISGFCLTE